MRLLSRLVLLTVGLSLAISPAPSSASPPHFHGLTPLDRAVGFAAAKIASRSQERAFSWLRQQPDVQRVAWGQDHQTIEIWFRDGATVPLAPALTHAIQRPPTLPRLSMLPRSRPAAASTGRAAVLEPFAELSSDPANAGKDIADLLARAGFKVDIFRNDQVTIPLLEKLSDYSVIYMQSHSGVLDNGHAALVVGETDHHQYDGLQQECNAERPPLCSVRQMLVAGSEQLWIGITDYFVQQHLSAFPDSSILFLNGCSIMRAPAFLAALHNKNLASIASWDGEASSGITELSAYLFFTAMARGSTVDQSLQDVAAQGFATSVLNNQIAHLKQDGYGEDTLSQAFAGTPPRIPPTETPQPSATPSATPAPTATPAVKPATKRCPKNSKKKGTKCVCKKGYTMKKGKCVKKKK